MARSIIVLGTATGVPHPPPVVHAYGAPDDHHRLTVLLACRVEQILGRESEQTRVCQDPRAVWSDRMGALRRALDAALEASNEPHPFGIADIDALATSDRGNWDEWAIFKEREKFNQVLMRAIDRAGWVVVRPNPSADVSKRLDELDADAQLADAPVPQHGLPAEMLDLIPPDCRPIAVWLNRTGRLSEARLDDILEEAKDVGEHLLGLAYDALPRTARETGKLLSAVRRPQRLNGFIGQFPLGDTEPSPARLPEAGVEALRTAGFLQPNVDGSQTVRMPRKVRALLGNQARLSLREEVKQVHARLATELLPEGATMSLRLEVPFHALRSGDLERAKATARFSADLRDFATRLSREGEYADAANLFQHIVDAFDPNDAYAHEYLGYNLARAAGTKEKDRILRAYEIAHRSANEKNPLYHGRLLGFRAEVGEDVAAEFDQVMKRYASENPPAATYFVEAVFKGVARGRREDLRARFVGKWGSLLKRLAPSVLGSAS